MLDWPTFPFVFVLAFTGTMLRVKSAKAVFTRVTRSELTATVSSANSPAADVQGTLEVVFSGILSTFCSRVAGTLAAVCMSIHSSSHEYGSYTLYRRIGLQNRIFLEHVSIP